MYKKQIKKSPKLII